MAKKSKRVKRILGVKVPKPIGRILANPAGRLLIAGAATAGVVAIARHPQTRAAATAAMNELSRVGHSAGMAAAGIVRAAATPLLAPAQPLAGGRKGKKARKNGSARMQHDEAERA